MHFKFTSDNGLEIIAKKCTKLYLTLGEKHMTEKHKLSLRSVKSGKLKKTRDL